MMNSRAVSLRIFHGADGNDYIEGNYGNDFRLYGDFDGDDYISGGQGRTTSYLVVVENDKLSGGDGNNYLTGRKRCNDELQAHGAYNILSGGTGDDKLYGGGGMIFWMEGKVMTI